MPAMFVTIQTALPLFLSRRTTRIAMDTCDVVAKTVPITAITQALFSNRNIDFPVVVQRQSWPFIYKNVDIPVVLLSLVLFLRHKRRSSLNAPLTFLTCWKQLSTFLTLGLSGYQWGCSPNFSSSQREATFQSRQAFEGGGFDFSLPARPLDLCAHTQRWVNIFRNLRKRDVEAAFSDLRKLSQNFSR